MKPINSMHTNRALWSGWFNCFRILVVPVSNLRSISDWPYCSFLGFFSPSNCIIS